MLETATGRYSSHRSQGVSLGDIQQNLRTMLFDMTSRDGSVFSWIQQMLQMRILETDRIVLRQFCQDDLRDLNTWEEAPGERYTALQAQSLLDFCFQSYRKWGMGPWGMLSKKDRMMVGNCGFCRIDFKHNWRGQLLRSPAVPRTRVGL